MNYLSVSAVKNAIPQLHFPVSELEEIALIQEMAKLFPDFEAKDFEQFFENQKDTQKRVFEGWIENDAILLDCLTKQKLSKSWKDFTHIQEHQFFADFQEFVTPYLYPVLKTEISLLNAEKAKNILSFSVLLIPEKQNVIQDVVSEWYELTTVELIAYCSGLKNDVVIYEKLHKELSDSLLAGLNSLNERHYGVRMQIMEKWSSLLYHEKASKRLALFILERIKGLQLAPEHQLQVRELESGIKTGKVSVEKSKISWLRLAVSVFLILLLGAGVFVLFFIEPNPVERTRQEETSFMQFSETERHQLDSLIQDIQSEERNMSSPAALDENIPFIGEQLVQKRDWRNELFKKLQRCWANNDTVIQTKVFSASKAVSQIYPGTKALDLLNGSVPAEFHNNSLQTILLIVFKNQKGEPVFTKYISAKSKFNFKINEGDVLVAVSGSNVASIMHFGDMPFREINYSFYENLSNAFRVKDHPGKQIKTVWETMGTSSYLLDLSNSLIVM